MTTLKKTPVTPPDLSDLDKENQRLRAMLRQEQTERQRLEQELALLRARLRLLSPWDPRDYMRLLWWVLVRPDLLRDYRAYLDDWGEMMLARHAGWLVATLLWLPVAVWVSVPWLLGVLPLSAGGGVALLAGLVGGWVVTGVVGTHENALSALAGVMTAAILLLIVLALVGGLAVVVAANSVMLPLGVAAMMLAMSAVAVAGVLRLQVAEVLAGVTAVLIGAAALIVMWQQASFSPGAVVLMLFAISMVGFIEDRHQTGSL